MNNRPSILALFGSLTLSLVACSQPSASSSAQYAPTSATAVNEAGHAPLANAKIISSCPKLINIGGGTTMDCTFQEAGYSGKFTVYENPNYYEIFTVSPTSGNKKTKFVVKAMDSGGGKFSVSDSKGKKIILDVRVSS
jgi:hypothetical protein